MIENFYSSADIAIFTVVSILLAALLGGMAMWMASKYMRVAWGFHEIFRLNLKVVFVIALADFLAELLFFPAIARVYYVNAGIYAAAFHVITAFFCLAGTFYLCRKTSEKTGLTAGGAVFLWAAPSVMYFIGYLISLWLVKCLINFLYDTIASLFMHIGQGTHKIILLIILFITSLSIALGFGCFVSREILKRHGIALNTGTILRLNVDTLFPVIIFDVIVKSFAMPCYCTAGWEKIDTFFCIVTALICFFFVLLIFKVRFFEITQSHLPFLKTPELWFFLPAAYFAGYLFFVTGLYAKSLA